MPAKVAFAVADKCLAFCRLFVLRPRMQGPGASKRCTPGSVDPYLVRQLAGRRSEALLCLYYDRQGAFRAERGCAGDPSSVRFDRDALLRGVLDHEARYVVVAHNHPSGAAGPSPQDVEATRQIRHMFGALGVTLIDHVIVGHGGDFFSFLQAGLI